MPKRYISGRLAAAAVLLSTLAACASLNSVPPGEPVANVQAQFGAPTYVCNLSNGMRRMIWSQQPMGQYAWAANVGLDGRIDEMTPVLNNWTFQLLATGDWTPERVRCQFGPPARIGRVGLGSANEVVWSYRFRENGAWNSLMYVYFGRDGDRVTRFHPGPDPMYERAWSGVD